MRQAQFVSRYSEEWTALEDWLEMRASRRSTQLSRAAGRDTWKGLRDEDMPAAYRRLCQQLSLARRRGYSPQLQARLQSLMQRGHAALYRPPRPRWYALPHFLARRFPQLVRSEWRCMLASALLFALPLLGMFVAIQARPDLALSVLSWHELANMESMYDPAAEHHRLGRNSGSDVQMFGYYVFNNISIGLRTFASGLLAGIGSAFVLVFNGVVIGTVAGHLHQAGFGETFWRFVAGHSALELTAIVIAGGAGLQLGLRLLAPGNRSRLDALAEGGKRGGLLCLGVFVMLLLAAFVEAFWSPRIGLPSVLMYAVGLLMWVLVLLWLWRGGRSDGALAEDADAAD